MRKNLVHRFFAACLWVGAGLALAGCSSDTGERQRLGGSGSGGKSAPEGGAGGGLPSTSSGGHAGNGTVAPGSGGSSETGGYVGSGGSAGDPSGTGGSDTGGTGGAAGAPATFAQVRGLLATSCAFTGCHHNGGGTKEVDLRDDGGLYDRLLGQAPSTAEAACRNRPLVVPGQPDMSLVAAMIGVDNGPRMNCGERMPKGCKSACLIDEEIQMVRDWIAAGAPAQ